MSLISKVKLPGHNTPYDIGVQWDNVKEKPDFYPAAAGIPYGEVDTSSTATVFTATIPGITELKDGVCMLLKNGVVTSASGFTININGLGAKPVYSNMAAATRETTIFNVNYTILFIYDTTRVSGGCWIYYRGYYADNDQVGYQLRTNTYVQKTLDAFNYYKILFTSADGNNWVPAASEKVKSSTSQKTVNQRPIDPFGKIVYCAIETTNGFNANADVTKTICWQQYVVTLGYSFNTTGKALTLTTRKPVYVKCTPQTNGSAIINSTTPIVQNLPTTEDNSIYIFLGIATSATAIELLMNHPIYQYKNGAIRLYTNADIPTKVSELTNDSGFLTASDNFGAIRISSDAQSVPANAEQISPNNTIILNKVAKTGSYTDLLDRPTNVSAFNNDSGYITSADVATNQVQPDWNATSGKSQILNKPTLATVATSGNYNDLSNIPTDKVQIFTATATENSLLGYTIFTLNCTLTEFNDAFNSKMVYIKYPNAQDKIEIRQVQTGEAFTLGSYSGYQYELTPMTEVDMDGGITVKGQTMIFLSTNQVLFPWPSSKQIIWSDNAELREGVTGKLNDNIVVDVNYNHTDNNFTNNLKTKLENLEIPTNVSAFTNDANYINQTQLNTAINNVNQFNVQIVTSLPTANIDTHTIYFISNNGSGQNIYDEYMYLSNKWEKIGTTDVDLSGYLKKTDISAWAKATTKPTYTATEVGAITSADVATYQVQPNWTATSGKGQILNKPTIPAAPGTLNTNNTTAQTVSTSEALSGAIKLHKISKTGNYNDLLNKPTIPIVPTKVSAFTNDSGYVKWDELWVYMES